MKEKIAVGIDIGGTNTVFGFVTETGEVLHEGKIKSKGHKNVNDFVILLTTTIKKILNFELNHFDLAGIGMGAPNGNYYSGSVEYAPNLEWKGIIPFVQLIKDHFDVPVILTNDANAGALGEKLYGGAKNMNDFIFITLGTGLGSGIVSGGKLIYGHDGFAGEIGHTFAVHNGRACGCGRKGCLETYASATGIVNTVKELLNNCETDSSLRGVENGKLNSYLIYQEAKKGDKLAIEAFDFTAKILGRTLADSVAYTSPQAIFLFGGLANAEDLLLKPVKHYLEEYILNIYKDKVEILSSQLKNGQAAVLGAAALIWNEV